MLVVEKDRIKHMTELLATRDSVVHHSLVRELQRLTGSDGTSTSQLADVIMKDPGLTSQVLRIANTTYFNPTGSPITTVSRAIFTVGFDTVRTLCLTIKVLEDLLKKRGSLRLIESLARAIEAAAQARMLCDGRSKQDQEEVFVAALLMHVGEMLLWTLDEKELPGVTQWSASATRSVAMDACEAALGFPVKRLNAELGKQWRLSELMVSANTPGSVRTEAIELVCLADALGEAVALGGSRDTLRALTSKAAILCKIKDSDALARREAGSQLARDIAASFGNPQLNSVMAGRKPPPESKPVHDGPLLMPNTAVQLGVLQDIMGMMQGGIDMAQLFQKVLDGLHHGVGLERVMVAIFDRERRYLVPKTAIPAATDWCQGRQFIAEKNEQNLFFRLFQHGAPVWVKEKKGDDWGALSAPELRRLSGEREFLISPIMATGRQIGVLYADQKMSERALADDQFHGFTHFARQLNVCMDLMALRK